MKYCTSYIIAIASVLIPVALPKALKDYLSLFGVQESHRTKGDISTLGKFKLQFCINILSSAASASPLALAFLRSGLLFFMVSWKKYRIV